MLRHIQGKRGSLYIGIASGLKFSALPDIAALSQRDGALAQQVGRRIQVRPFAGFPIRGRIKFTPIPDSFLNSLLPQITDIGEIKVTLYVFEIVYAKKGEPRYATYQELLGNLGLRQSLAAADGGIPGSLPSALAKAVERGTLLHLTVDQDGKPQDIYFLNDEKNRLAIEKIKSGELVLAGLKNLPAPETPPSPRDVFTLYEENIGMLTPLIAEDLKEAEKIYPPDWLQDAFKEAVARNKRNWRYVARVLERWAIEGKQHGTTRRYLKENTDPDKFVKGKYGHVVQR